MNFISVLEYYVRTCVCVCLSMHLCIVSKWLKILNGIDERSCANVCARVCLIARVQNQFIYFLITILTVLFRDILLNGDILLDVLPRDE